MNEYTPYAIVTANFLNSTAYLYTECDSEQEALEQFEYMKTEWNNCHPDKLIDVNSIEIVR